MKLITVILFVSVLACCSYKDEVVEVKNFDSLIEREKEIQYEFGIYDTVSNISIPCFDINPIDTIICYYYNRKLVSIKQIKEGLGNGVYVEFDENRCFYMVGGMLDNKSHGIFINFKECKAYKLSLLNKGNKEFTIEDYNGSFFPCNPFDKILR